ncbi:putative nucleotidyltransferase (plasmid) [Methylobacterium phyllosphaerae]|uniref:Nucleotidyltransferase n=1 Tax=Methylobacterium phyllosphaerae TaxID=418223 RepID=A0AAE8L9K4_9HYPH|nr:nucleotidyltransferase family protein [Methylobacterium phyllosphaerae]APT35034.1 putative nucleotidyltransferase [Methylobacterium phyllosphaerae]SFH67047.1 Predicted nucleotidyltransferase [Methylobacterium phyllosphaerae]
MQILQIHDVPPTAPIVVDPRAVLPILGQRAIRANWEVAGVARHGEALIVTGEEAADRLEALSRSTVRIPGGLLVELIHQTAQVIWGEFKAFEEGEEAPWVILRAIDSTWCEVETDDESVLDQVRRTFADVRAGLLAAVISTLRSRRADLEGRGVVSASVFGSTARGEERPDSDIDIVVDISPDVRISLTGFAVLQADLQEMLGRRVDLVEWRNLEPHLLPSVRRDAVQMF